MTITKELLTRKDLMELFQVSQPTIIRLEAAGKLTPVRIGTRVRFRVSVRCVPALRIDSEVIVTFRLRQMVRRRAPEWRRCSKGGARRCG